MKSLPAASSGELLVFIVRFHYNLPGFFDRTDCLGDRAAVDLRKLGHGHRRHLVHAATRDLIERALDAGLFRLDGILRRQRATGRHNLLL